MSLSPFAWKTTKDGSLTLFDNRVGESYKSSHAAGTESHHVFIQPGLLEHPEWTKAQPFQILELGFGIGTNFRSLCSLSSPTQAIHFRSIERDLSGANFFRTEQSSQELQTLVEKKSYCVENLQAELLVGEFLPTLRSLPSEIFHSIFFDPFSPKANPESWSQEIFQECFRVLRPKGRLLTYSVSRIVKDALSATGFRWEKRDLPEILNKRSALLAFKTGTIQ